MKAEKTVHLKKGRWGLPILVILVLTSILAGIAAPTECIERIVAISTLIYVIVTIMLVHANYTLIEAAEDQNKLAKDQFEAVNSPRVYGNIQFYLAGNEDDSIDWDNSWYFFQVKNYSSSILATNIKPAVNLYINECYIRELARSDGFSILGPHESRYCGFYRARSLNEVVSKEIWKIVDGLNKNCEEGRSKIRNYGELPDYIDIDSLDVELRFDCTVAEASEIYSNVIRLDVDRPIEYSPHKSQRDIKFQCFSKDNLILKIPDRYIDSCQKRRE